MVGKSQHTVTLVVDRAFLLGATDTAPTFRRYAAAPEHASEPLTSDVALLPRENSDTTSVSALTLHLNNNGSTGDGGSPVTYAGSSRRRYDFNNYGGGESVTNSDLLQIEVFYSNHNSSLGDNVATIHDVTFATPGPPGPPSGLNKTANPTATV